MNHKLLINIMSLVATVRVYVHNLCSLIRGEKKRGTDLVDQEREKDQLIKFR